MKYATDARMNAMTEGDNEGCGIGSLVEECQSGHKVIWQLLW